MSLPRPSEDAVPIPRNVLKFMNSMPMTGDVVEWISQFRDALQQLLGGVDRVSVFLNANFNLLASEECTTDLTLIQGYVNTQLKDAYVTASPSDADKHIGLLLKYLQEWGFPFDEYQQPHVCYYYTHNYLGAILLFRYRGATPIPVRTLKTIEALRPFILFMLSDAVTRHKYVEPAPLVFNSLLGELCDELELDDRDIEILTLRLLGFQNVEIARRLMTSVSGVKKRTHRILEKAGINRFIELFTRRLMPELEEMIDATFTPGVRASSRHDAVILPWDVGEQPCDQVRTITVF